MNNGKIDPRLITAQQATEAALKPFKDAEKRAATTRLRLSEAEQALTLEHKENDRLADRFTDDNSAGNKKALLDSNNEIAALESRVDGFRKKLAVEEAAIEPLRAAHDATMVALAQAQLDANLAHLEEVWSASRDVVVKLEEQLVQARQVAYQDEQRFKALATQKRNSDQELSRRAASVRFRQNNPNEPGFQRVRSGFGL